MKIRELIEKLEQMDQEAEIYSYQPEDGEFKTVDIIEFVSADTKWAWGFSGSPQKPFLLI